MKDATRKELKARRPRQDALVTIDYCLSALYAERRKSIGDRAVANLTYEELIGALLQGRDLARKHPEDS